MSTEYSQAVRDVVRKIGTKAIDWADVVDWLVAGNIGQAIDDGLVTDKAYVLTDKGRELLRAMLLEELEEVAARSDKHEFRAQVSGHAVFKSPDVMLRSTDGALFNDRTFPSREYSVTLTPVEAEPMRCLMEYCVSYSDGNCTNPEPVIPMSGPPKDDGSGACWSFRSMPPDPEPELDPLCPVCGKTASEHKSGLFWGYGDHSQEPPCPVCGKPASEHQDGLFCCGHCGGNAMRSKSRSGKYTAFCLRPGCRVCTPPYDTQAQLDAAWNRRA